MARRCFWIVVVCSTLFRPCASHAWVTEVVDRPLHFGSGGRVSSIGIDPAGAIHIFSYNDTLSACQYSTNASGTWTTSVIDAEDGDYGDLAVDRAGHVHLAYSSSGTQYAVRYATNASGAWDISTVRTLGALSATDVAVALDTTGHAHVIYNLSRPFSDVYDYSLAYATNVQGTWQETILYDDYATYPAIAVDSAGGVHISYFGHDGSPGGLKYVTNVSGPWTTSTVDTVSVGHGSSIALDTGDHVHISYCDDYGGLKYASNVTGSWEVTQALTATPTVNDMVLDAEGFAHILGEDSGTLWYITNVSGSWEYDTFPRDRTYPPWDVFYARAGGLALDETGEIYVSFARDEDDPELYLATIDSGSWPLTRIASPADSGLQSAIALDSTGGLHAAYIDDRPDWYGRSDLLRYATNASGSWETITLDSEASREVPVSIAIDRGNRVHIAYGHYNCCEGQLGYATNASGGWVTNVVGHTPWTAFHHSILLDSDDRPHIVYSDVNLLKHAINASGSWTSSTVGWSPEGFADLSASLDRADKLHLAYIPRGQTITQVRYATNASGVWVGTVVENTAKLYDSLSIGVDSRGKVHISHYVWPLQLRYVTNAFGPWVSSVLDSTGDVGDFTSLAIDSMDKVHISYYDATSHDLKYVSNSSGVWTRNTVCDRPQACGKYSSIAVSPTGIVHIGHHGGDGTFLLTTGEMLPPMPCHDVDQDDDGYPGESDCDYPLMDCNDTNPDVNPAVPEICDNLIDDNCDSLVDSEDTLCGPPPWSGASSALASGGTEISAGRPGPFSLITPLALSLGLVVLLKRSQRHSAQGRWME